MELLPYTTYLNLKMEASEFSETSLFSSQTRWCHNPEDHNVMNVFQQIHNNILMNFNYQLKIPLTFINIK
jgi:hypothetical protein